MSEVTVKQLANMVGIPVARLLAQFKDAGIKVRGEDAGVSEKEKSAAARLSAAQSRQAGDVRPSEAAPAASP